MLLVIALMLVGCAGYSRNYRYDPYSDHYHYPYGYHGSSYGHPGYGYHGGGYHW